MANATLYLFSVVYREEGHNPYTVKASVVARTESHARTLLHTRLRELLKWGARGAETKIAKVCTLENKGIFNGGFAEASVRWDWENEDRHDHRDCD